MGILFKRVRAIGVMMRDQNVPFVKKLLVIATVLYILSPIDLVPLPIFPFSWMDDLAVFLIVIWYLKDTLDQYWLGGKPVDLSKEFSSDDIVEGVEYEVHEEDDRGKVINLKRKEKKDDPTDDDPQ